MTSTVEPPVEDRTPGHLVAYRLHAGVTMPLVPAAAKRVWMETTRDRFAYRCLPLLIANQAGWVLLSEHTVLATWDGRPGKEGLRLEYLRGDPPYPAVSHFGQGILTWTIPYLFRTSPGYNLLVRGPANHPKDGVSPLEGVVETDWTAATATMNWKLTRPGLTVRFDVAEPVAMIVPSRRGELEEFCLERATPAEDSDLARRHAAWSNSRREFLTELAEADGDPRHTWQKDYFHGRDPGGPSTAAHQHKLVLKAVVDQPSSNSAHDSEQDDLGRAPPLDRGSNTG